MKYEDIAKLELGNAFSCRGCGKRIVNGVDKIHFLSEPEFFSADNPLKENSFENVEPYCENCHNFMFGKDIDI